MAQNILLLDIDGVVIKKRARYSSERFSEEYHIPYEKILPFFKNEFLLCETGKADLKQELQKYIPTWSQSVSVDGFIDYWFSAERERDERVIALLDEFRGRGIPCYAASDQEKYRAEDMRTKVGLDRHFDKMFFSCDVGYMKKQKEFFENVLRELHPARPADVRYWDDDERVVATAHGVGIDAHLFTDFENFRDKLKAQL